jgi:predicted nucleic acid-binding protein
VLIYHLEGIAPYADLTEDLIARIASGRLEAIISAVTLTELLAKPYGAGDAGRVARIEAFWRSFPHLTLIPLDAEVARWAARLRGQYGLKTPHALIAATGLAAGADALVTNDAAWDRLRAEGVSVISLDASLKRSAD